MKKISKESIQNFMLLHAEKLILGGCIAATGLFVWMSMGDGKGLTQSPSDLLTSANSAQNYIERDTWSELEPFRHGESEAKEKIVEAKKVDSSKYPLSMIGSPAPSSLLRLDPEIVAPEQLNAVRFTGGILMDLPNIKSPLSNFYSAPTLSEDAGVGFQVDDDFGPGGGDFGAASSTGLPEDYPKLERSGTFNEVNALTMQGLRPQSFSISADTITTNVLDVVCVTAVVDFQKQAAAFEKAFGESVAFNAKRDRPVYQFLQIQRREVADKETPWTDISETVRYNYPKQFPKSLTKMPLQLFRSAPEVIAPENYDPITSGVIPGFVMLDYQQLASHPALEQRREFPNWEPPKERQVMPDSEVVPGGGILGPQNDLDDGYGPGSDGGTNDLRRGSETDSYLEAIAMRKLGGQYRLVRFFDLFLPTKESRSKVYEYRVRVWVGDPNQLDPTDGFVKNRGMRLDMTKEGNVKFASNSNDGMGGGMSEMEKFDDEDGPDGIDGQRLEIVQDITTSMLSPKVRTRLNAASDLKMMQDRLEDAARAKKPVEPFQVAEFTKDGQLEPVQLPPSASNYAYVQYLRFARPSPWSESVKVGGQKSSTDVYAGATVRSRTVSMDAGAGEVEFDLVEPQIEIVVSSWIRALGTKLPSEKKIYLGETLNFNSPAYVTHPVSWQVLAAQNPRVKSDDIKKFIVPFRTNETVVDAFAGQQLALPNSKKQTIETPTEVLTMDASGNLKVSNQFDSATDYRNEITKQDESRFFGTPRRSRRDKDKEDDDYLDGGDPS